VIVESLTTNCTPLSMEAHEWFYHFFLKNVVDVAINHENIYHVDRFSQAIRMLMSL
jgi:hypothetical protein